MGIHRNPIHPKFGNFVLLGTVLMDVEVDLGDVDHPIDYNPCLECKLCVAACPVGAIGPDGSFNFSSCFTHNYREFLGGFSDWVEQIAERAKRSIIASASRRPKPRPCGRACPTAPITNRPIAWRCVLPAKTSSALSARQAASSERGGAAAAGARRAGLCRGRIRRRGCGAPEVPQQTVKTVANGLRPRTIAGLLNFMPYVFQPNQSRGLNATFHFKFTGAEQRDATIAIKNRTFEVQDGFVGNADLRVTADAKTWLGFLAREKSLPLRFGQGKNPHQGRPPAPSRLRQMLPYPRHPAPGTRHKQIEIVPQPSLLKGEPARYRKNDPAVGKIRWQGKLVLAETVDVTYNAKTFRFKAPDGAEIPFDYLPGQFLTLHIAPEGLPNQAFLHHRLDPNLARPHRDHRQARRPRSRLALAARRVAAW